MSARMQFPLSQRRHTNIAVVRYAKNGVKLEIACYKNKVISYRSGVETRMDEVLQVERIFANVARGQLASEKEIETVFGDDMAEKDAIKYMLDHGELQVAQQERTAEVDEIFKDVAFIISQKCVNTKTQHPFPSHVIEQALRSIGAAVKLDQPVKKQALSLIHALIEANIIPIARANMKIRCTTPTAGGLEKLRAWCQENGVEIVESDPAAAVCANESEKGRNTARSLLLIMQPHLFRDLDIFVKEELPSGSAIHMIEAAVTEVGDADVVLDANAVFRANAHGECSETGGAPGDSHPRRIAPSSTSAAGSGGAGGHPPRSAGRDTDQASSLSNANAPSQDATTGRRAKRAKGGKKKTSKYDSSSDEDDGDSEESNNDEGVGRGKRGGRATDKAKQSQPQSAAHIAGAVDDLTAELQKLRVANDGDSEGEGGRKGKGKKNKKKGGGANASAAASTKKDGAMSMTAASDDDDEDDTSRKGKGRKNKKNKKAAAAAMPEKTEQEAEEAFSESDEELMVNRKQRAKKQHQETQHDTNNWDDEEEFDYGEEEEEEHTA